MIWLVCFLLDACALVFAIARHDPTVVIGGIAIITALMLVGLIATVLDNR